MEQQSKRVALPLSPKVTTRALKTTLKPSDMSGAAAEVAMSFPDAFAASPAPDAAASAVTTASSAPVETGARDTANVDASEGQQGGGALKAPGQSEGAADDSKTPVPSPPAAKDDSEGREASESSDAIGDVIQKRGTISSRRASSNIARRRFLKAKTAVAFGVRLSNLSRTSMLRARAPKEFSVLERVQRLEEKVVEMKKEAEAAKVEVDERMVELEESKMDDWISDAVKALASRMQKVETSALSAKSAEPAEQTIHVLKKMQLALSTHIEKTESLAEESFVNRLVSLQQRMVETASSYQNMASEISKIKVPDSDDDMRAFKILQYHTKVQGIRHRLTHLDAENLMETLLFNRMKQEREVMEKHGVSISENVTDAYVAIQDQVDVCVDLNRSLWDRLISVDKAAGNAWGIIGRNMTGQSGGIASPDERRLSFLSGDVSPTTVLSPALSPTNASPGSQPHFASLGEMMDLDAVHRILDEKLDERLERFALEDNKASIMSNALKAIDEKLSATSKSIKELQGQNNDLKIQLDEKADDATVQMALRASRMAQASIEGKADAEALESMEAFLQKCRKEVVKLRSTQEAGIAGTRRILERKLKKVMKDTQELAENQAANQGAFIGTGQVTLSPRNGQVERGTRWKSDTSKFLPGSPAVSGEEGGVVTKGNFLVGLPGGVKGKMMAREDPPRVNDVEPASEVLGKIVVSSGLRGGVEDEDVTTRPTVPKPSALKPSPIKKRRGGGSFWGNMDVQVPKNVTGEAGPM
jgi:hypothetical protein